MMAITDEKNDDLCICRCVRLIHNRHTHTQTHVFLQTHAQSVGAVHSMKRLWTPDTKAFGCEGEQLAGLAGWRAGAASNLESDPLGLF